MFEAKVNDILNNLDVYHSRFYNADPFSNPGLYFHKKALEKSPRQYEYIYAMLVAWGMQRTGKSGPQMKYFTDFENSLNNMNDLIETTDNITLENINEQVFEKLHLIFGGIDVMESRPKIVGHSKVLAHLFPNLVIPIDTRYTMKYLFEKDSVINKKMNQDIEGQWITFMQIHEKFVRPIVLSDIFKEKASTWMANNEIEYKSDTSMIKIIDNLVIGANKRRTN